MAESESDTRSAKTPPKATSTRPPKTTGKRTLDLVPNFGELIKPAELIDITGAGGLTLAARRLYNLLIAAAFGPEMGEAGTEFEIPLAELRGTHKGTERIEESILALMRTIVVARLPDGSTRRVALLGGNDLDSPGRSPGLLRYSFDPRLVPLLRESRIFGILELRVMAAFSTKYALALYEALTRRVRLSHIYQESFDADAMRELLGVPPGKLLGTGNLRKVAIEPAVAEINALAPFSIAVEDVKVRRRVVGFRVAWWQKSPQDYRSALAELERPRPGRSARIRGRSENVSDLLQLEERHPDQDCGSP